jgi:hypothetical protein
MVKVVANPTALIEDTIPLIDVDTTKGQERRRQRPGKPDVQGTINDNLTFKPEIKTINYTVLPDDTIEVKLCFEILGSYFILAE